MEVPLTTQPTSQNTPAQGGWMPIPAVNVNCPPGLQYLTQVDQLLVHQQVEVAEALTGFDTANKYIVKNTLGQQVYYAKEESNWALRNCCAKNLRAFNMKILDNYSQEVMHLIRPCRCAGCCCPTKWLQEVEVQSPPGTTIGYVRERFVCCVPTYDIQNAAGDTVLVLKAPVCIINCCSDINYPIYAKDGQTEVGMIKKQWSGLVQEYCTTADNFGISFPMDLDVNMKATLLGALFLIDFLYFETGN